MIPGWISRRYLLDTTSSRHHFGPWLGYSTLQRIPWGIIVRILFYVKRSPVQAKLNIMLYKITAVTNLFKMCVCTYSWWYFNFRFLLVNAGVIYFYVLNFQSIDEEEYGGMWEITKEGFMTSFAGFLVRFFNLKLHWLWGFNGC